MPNINHNWDTVIEGPALGIGLDESMTNLDQSTREKILNNNNVFRISAPSIFKPGVGYPYKITEMKQKNLTNVRTATMDFYRFQL